MTGRGYDADAEVVRLCSELIRIDTTNYGNGKSVGERRAAEYVAEQMAEVGIESQIYESEPGRANGEVQRLGEHDGGAGR